MTNDVQWIPPLKEGDVPEGKTAQWDGVQWNIVDHLTPEPKQMTEEEKKTRAAAICISKRDYFLSQSDFVFSLDSPVNPEDLPKWIEYRQALRDMPVNNPEYWLVDPDKVNWPTKPIFRKK